MARVTYTPKPGATVRVVGGMADQAAYRAAQKVRGDAMSNIRALGRVDSGKMLDSVQVRRAPEWTAMAPTYVIGPTATAPDGFPYPIVQELGSRAHGPVRAPFLVFRIRGAGPLIFAKWVRGVTGAHFMELAAHGIRIRDFLP